MINETFFAVMYNTDQTEGRGSSIFTGIGFRKKSDAIAFVRSAHYAKRYGVMGTVGDEFNVKEMMFTIYDNFAEAIGLAEELARAETRFKALSKLTDEEREVLGLSKATR